MMKPFTRLYLNLLQNYNQNLDTSDFLILCYAHLDNGRCKERIQCSSKQEAEKLSNHIEFLYNKEEYQKAFEKNQQIKNNADFAIKKVIKECVSVICYGLDDKVFDSAFELSKIQCEQLQSDVQFSYDMDDLYEKTLLNYKLLINHLLNSEQKAEDCK